VRDRAAVLLGVAILAGCGSLRGPAPDAKEHVPGERYRLLPEPPDHLWPVVLNALELDGFRVRRFDAQRRIETSYRYHGSDVLKRLSELGDLSRARESGLRGISEYIVTYEVFLVPAGESGTSLKVTSAIEAIDRTQSLFLPGGVIEPLARHIDVPSRGTAERELLRRLSDSLYTAEEMFLRVGELGQD